MNSPCNNIGATQPQKTTVLDVSPKTLEKMSYSELVSSMERALAAMNEENYAPEVIDAYLEALERKRPVPDHMDAQASYDEFQQKVRLICGSESGDEQRQEKRSVVKLCNLLRVGLVAALLFVCMFGTMIVAQAAGVDVFGRIAQWTDELFYFLSDEDQTGEMEMLPTVDIAEQYISIQEALTACGITDDLSPTWYPQRFSEMDVEVVNTENSDVVNATFSNNAGQFFSIVITVYNSDSSVDLMRFEKDGSFVEQYVSQERAFYIFSNTNTITAAWFDGHLLIEISGDITVDEVKSIISSIGDGL